MPPMITWQPHASMYLFPASAITIEVLCALVKSYGLGSAKLKLPFSTATRILQTELILRSMLYIVPAHRVQNHTSAYT